MFYSLRIFVFKILFRFTWWVAPDKDRVNKIFDMYLDYIKQQEDYAECQQRQAEMDACVRPRTETYEHLTCARQRVQYAPSMPERFIDSNQPRNHYTDYEEAKKYHEGA